MIVYQAKNDVCLLVNFESTGALIVENALVIVAIEKITPLFVFFSLRFFGKYSFAPGF